MENQQSHIDEAREKLSVALSHVRDFRCAIDGGAHVGDWARILAGRFRDVLLFEPGDDGPLYVPPNVVIHRFALGYHTGRADIMSTPKKQGARSRFIRFADMDMDGIVVGQTEVTTIDHLGRDDVDFIKLDLEGAEYYALLGAEKTIERCRPVIMIEDERLYAKKRYGIEEHAARKLLEFHGYQVISEMTPNLLLCPSR